MEKSNILMPENAIETLRALVAGVSGLNGAEIVIRARKTLRLESKNRMLDEFEAAESVGVGLRLLRGQRASQSFCSQLEMDALRGLVSRAEEMLEHTPEDALAQIQPIEFDGDTGAGTEVDPTFELIPSEEKANRIVNLESNVLEADPRIKRTRGTKYQESYSREWLWTLGSKKVLSTARTAGYLGTSAVAESGQDSQIAGESTVETHYYDLDWGLVARNAASRALKLLGAKPVPSAKCHVLFTNRVMTDLLGLLAGALSGDSVAQGLSFLKGDLGKKTLSPLMTLVDDPQQKKRIGTRYWDSEGIPTSRLELIREGSVEAFAHNLRSAKQCKTRSTGNALRASERMAPVVGFHNLSMEPGKKDFVDLLRDMGRGFVVYKLIGVHTANPVTGDFSFGAAGTWVENGEESRPVGGVALAGNIKELFSRIVSVGRDHRWSGSVAAPSVLCENVSLAGEG